MTDLKATMRRFYDEIFNEANLASVDELLADDFVEHEELPPGVPPGKDAVRALASMLRSAFPDFQATVEEMLQDGNKVIVRARFSGTHEGDFMGIPATGKNFNVPVIDIVEFANGKAIAHWGIMDSAAMMPRRAGHRNHPPLQAPRRPPLRSANASGHPKSTLHGSVY